MPPADDATSPTDSGEVSGLAPIASQVEILCEPISDRTDGKPGWCNEFPEPLCNQYFVVDIHSEARPCVWLDVGCRASSAVACPMAVAGSDGSGAAGAVLVLLVAALVAGAAFFLRRRWPSGLAQMGLPESPLRGKAKVESRDEEEAGELLDAGNEIGDSDLTMAEAAEMSAEAARSAAVACAAAHALLASNTAETQPNDAPKFIAEPAPIVQPLPAAMEGGVPDSAIEAAGPSGGGSASGGATSEKIPILPGPPKWEEHAKSPRLEDPELPAINLRKERAIFDDGDLFNSMSARGPAQTVTAPPGGDEDTAANDDDDDGYNTKPSSATLYMASKKNLAMSLD